MRGQGNEVVVVLLRRPADDVQSVLKDGGGREERQFARQGGLEFAVAQVLSPDFRAPAGKLRAKGNELAEKFTQAVVILGVAEVALKGGAPAERILATLSLISLSLQGMRPRDWPTDLVDAPGDNSPQVDQMLHITGLRQHHAVFPTAQAATDSPQVARGRTDAA